MSRGRCIVRVWDVARGDVVRTIWEATEADLDEVEETYGDDPEFAIQYEERD